MGRGIKRKTGRLRAKNLKKTISQVNKFKKEIIKTKKVGEVIRQTQVMLRSILEIEPLGVYIVNKKGIIDYVNSAMIVISGDTYEQFKSLNVFELPMYKKIGLDKKIRSVFEGHSFKLEPVECTSHFSKKTTIRNFIGIPYEEETEKKALIFVQDITAIKRAEEEMRKAMELKSQFTSMVSHELRTPLAAIKEGISIVFDGIVGELNAKQKEFLDIAKRNVDRLSRLVNDVLGYQKLEADKMMFNMQEGDINDVVIEVEKTMAPAAKEKNLELKIGLENNLPKLRFDKDKIIQVLTNLVNNAIKFTEQGYIIISTCRHKNIVRVSVGDTGRGIKKEDMPKLFQAFEQLKRDGSEEKSGTGLGLTISKDIIGKHNGKIWAESEVGKGTKFHLALPIKERRG